MLERFKQFLLPLDYLPSQTEFKTMLARYDFGETPAETGRVQLLTIHQAKGLEFDAVFLPCLQKRVGRDEAPLLYTDTFYEGGQFHFLLAEKLGKTVSELLSQLGSAEITEWIAYLNLNVQAESQAPDPKAELTRRFGTRVKKKGR